MLTHAMLALAAISATPAAADALAAFAAVCRPADGIEPLRQRAAAQGWQAYEPRPDEGVYKLLALGRAALATGKGRSMCSARVWRLVGSP